MFHLGIDLGGTKIEGVVLDQDGSILARRRIDTEQEGGYEHILDRIRQIYEMLRKENANEPHTLGIGTPGAISQKTGKLKNSNTLCLNNRLTREELEQKLGRSVFLENDANCFALAEAVLGAGAGYSSVFGVIMGTGCGGGIIMNGRIVRGLQGIAGEWGHMSIDPAGPLCYCGSKGCVETFISGGGLEKAFYAAHRQNLRLKEIVERARKGEPRCEAFMNEFHTRFGRSLANLINILDPDIIVLGGGLSNIEELYSAGVEAVGKCVFNDDLTTPIVKNRLGDSAGVIGAALLGKQEQAARHGT